MATDGMISEILIWINNALQMNITKLEEAASSGAVLCRMINFVYSGAVPLERVAFDEKSDYEKIHNFKVLQDMFNALKIEKDIKIDMLIKGNSLYSLKFLQWLKRHCESVMNVREAEKVDYTAKLHLQSRCSRHVTKKRLAEWKAELGSKYVCYCSGRSNDLEWRKCTICNNFQHNSCKTFIPVFSCNVCHAKKLGRATKRQTIKMDSLPSTSSFKALKRRIDFMEIEARGERLSTTELRAKLEYALKIMLGKR